MWFQKQFSLPARARGSYLITDTVLEQLPEIRGYKVGLLHLFVQHTSCALSLNENWDEVRFFPLSFLLPVQHWWGAGQQEVVGDVTPLGMGADINKNCRMSEPT